MKRKFESVMHSEEWVIFQYNKKYYVADEDRICLVNLKYKESARNHEEKAEYSKYSYFGLSDSGKLYLGFDRESDWKQLYAELDKYVEMHYEKDVL